MGGVNYRGPVLDPKDGRCCCDYWLHVMQARAGGIFLSGLSIPMPPPIVVILFFVFYVFLRFLLVSFACVWRAPWRKCASAYRCLHASKKGFHPQLSVLLEYDHVALAEEEEGRHASQRECRRTVRLPSTTTTII